MWMWLSKNPGTRARPRRLTSLVWCPTVFSTYERAPTRKMRPRRIARASATSFRWLTVMTVPFMNTTSAVGTRIDALDFAMDSSIIVPIAIMDNPCQPQPVPTLRQEKGRFSLILGIPSEEDFWGSFGAGERDRTGNVQPGKPACAKLPNLRGSVDEVN